VQESGEGEDDAFGYGFSAMQGWRTDMVCALMRPEMWTARLVLSSAGCGPCTLYKACDALLVPS
jgi:hypothetical protein